VGGAFAIGLARDVKDLYRFLCRNYVAASRDRIILFGFSRGAFTVRILEGLILRCGIVKASIDSLLTEYVEHAYSEYKRDASLGAPPQHIGVFLDYGCAVLIGYSKGGSGRSRPPGRHLRFPHVPIRYIPISISSMCGAETIEGRPPWKVSLDL
jgi:hypothetical protein